MGGRWRRHRAALPALPPTSGPPPFHQWPQVHCSLQSTPARPDRLLLSMTSTQLPPHCHRRVGPLLAVHAPASPRVSVNCHPFPSLAAYRTSNLNHTAFVLYRAAALPNCCNGFCGRRLFADGDPVPTRTASHRRCSPQRHCPRAVAQAAWREHDNGGHGGGCGSPVDHRKPLNPRRQ